MMNDVSEVFQGWLVQVEIQRPNAGSYVNGVWVPTSSSPKYIQAVVQNANPKDLLVVPEGLRTSESIKIHTTSEMKTVDEVGETDADVVEYNSKNYRVYNVADRQIGNYYKAIAVRMKP